MSAESGVPTYRGEGGIWHKYNWEEYAFQKAFDVEPDKVIEFHNVRRKAVFRCKPHQGHFFISELQESDINISIITQNIDGMHQRAGSDDVVELHGSLWSLRCEDCNKFIDDYNETYKTTKCNCGKTLRPNIVWFGDVLNMDIINQASSLIEKCNLFISIGTSGVVWPAAGFPDLAKNSGAYCIEINTERTELSSIFNEVINCKASEISQYLM
jgi:NAD-dependent deacetylase